jgi:predicted AlkP superfamily pyrophosphatase or phosphodiesterase
MPSPARVVLIVVDGLRPDALSPQRTPVLDGMLAAGAATLTAMAVRPSISLPCHVSIFCGVPPERHGVLENVWSPPQPPIPSLIDLAGEAGLGTAAFYSWEELRDLSRPGSLDFSYYQRRREPEAQGDLDLAAFAADYLAAHRPGFTFLYLGAADEIGHHYGWMSEPYLDAVAADDRAVGMVSWHLASEGLLHDTAFLVLADHGGHDFDHSEGTEEDVTVPWLACGPGIRSGYRIPDPVSHPDTAPTVAHLLGLPIPGAWTGRILSEALTE